LTDVTARVQDATNGIDGEVLLRSLQAGRLANKREAPVKLDARFAFKQPLLKGELKGDTQLTLDTESGSLALRATDLGFKRDVPGASAVDAQIKGDVAWDGASKSVDAHALALQLSAHAGTLKLAGSTLAVERFAVDP